MQSPIVHRAPQVRSQEKVASPMLAKGAESELADALVSRWGSNPPAPAAPKLFEPAEVPRGVLCSIASGLFRFSRRLSRLGSDTGTLSNSLLLFPAAVIALANAPLSAIAGFILRKSGAESILKRLSFDAAEYEAKSIVFSGGSYFRTASQQQRFELAQHCLAKAIEDGDQQLQRACSPKNFAITESGMQKALLRMLVEYAESDRNFGLFCTSEINALDREFKVEMLSKVLNHARGSHWFVKDIDLDQWGHLQAQKRHLAQLAATEPNFRKSAISDPFYICPIEDLDLRIELVREYMNLIPGETCQVIKKFKLGDAPDARFGLAMQAASLGSAAVISRLGEFELTKEQQDQVIQRTLETNIVGALPHLPNMAFPISAEQLEKLFCAAVENGKWSNASKLCELQRTGNNSIADHAVVKSDFKHLLAQAKDAGRLNPESSTTLEQVMATGCMPSDAIGSSLKHFGIQNREFLLDILRGCGESFGSSVLHQLQTLFPQPEILNLRDKEAIRDLLGHGFRGFSLASYRTFRDVWENSPLKAAALVKEWKALSSEILSGRQVSEELRANSLFPELVYAAYRPAGLTLQEAKELLRSQRDNSHHCAAFRAPEHGYQVGVQQVSQRTIRQGEKFNLERLRTHAKFLTEAGSGQTLSSGELTTLGILALQGNFEMLREARGQFLQHLIRNARSGRAHSLVSELLSLRERGFGPEDAFEAIPKMAELQGVVFKDLLHGQLKQLVDSYELQPGAKLEGRIRSILKVSPGHKITPSDTLEALKHQFSKLFSEDLRFLKTEQQKGTLTFGKEQREFEIFLTKSLPAYLGRAGAGLCTAQDTWSWNNKNFLQMIMVDRQANRIVGNIQLHLFTDPQGKRAMIARLNPVESILNKVDKISLAQSMVGAVRHFSLDNGLELYLPDQTGAHHLTNRQDFVGPLKAYYGEAISCNVQLTRNYTCTTAYRIAAAVPVTASEPLAHNFTHTEW